MKKRYLTLTLIIFFLLVSQEGSSQLTNWVRTLSGARDVDVIDSDYDDDGNLYFTGIFAGSVDFNPSQFVSASITSNGDYDVFVTKFDRDGKYQWVKRIGGAMQDNVNSIKAYHGSPDDEGLYITGDYEGTVDFDPSWGSTDEHTATDGTDAYVLHLDFDGNLKNTFPFSGDGNETIRDIRVMPNKFVFAGYYKSQFDLLPDNPGGLYTSEGATDIMIAAFSPSGGLYWARSIGGTDFEMVKCMDLDDEGNIYVGGEFSGSFDFNPLSDINYVNAVDKRDGFVSCFDPDGILQWVNTVGDTLYNSIEALTVKNDTIWSTLFFEERVSYLAGYMGGFPFFKTIYSSGGIDQLLRKELTDGTTQPDSYRHLKAAGSIFIRDIDSDERNNILITGFFYGNEFDMDPSEEDSMLFNSNGDNDIFLGKYSGDYDYHWGHCYGSSGSDRSYFVKARQGDSITLGGCFEHEVDFNPGGTAMNRTSQGNLDGFLMNVLPYNNETDILTFELDEQTSPAEIDNVNHTVDIEVSFGTDLGALIPLITVSERADIQPSDSIATDFTNPVIYTVMAEDSVNEQEWTVTVTEEEGTGTETLDKNSFVVYPNPATERIVIESPGEEQYVLQIFNEAGKLVLNQNVNKNKTFVDISGFNPGFYLISIQSGTQSVVKKILVSD